MTRRRGVIAALTGIVAAVARLKAQGIGTLVASPTDNQPLILDLTGISSLTVALGGREVKLTPEEIMDALEGR